MDTATSGHLAVGSSDLTPLQVAMRWKWRILAFALASAALTAVYVSRLQVRYGADLAMEFDYRQPKVLNVDNLLASQTIDAESLRTKMEVLRSPDLALEVVKRLDLNHRTDFCHPASAEGWRGPWDILRAKFMLGRPPLPPEGCSVTAEEAANQVLGAVSSYTDGRSYIVRIMAEASDPVLAAEIANAYAEAFISRESDDKRKVARDVSLWLSSYLATLREESVKADAAVAQYRDQHSLIAPHGETLAQQALIDMNAQLSLAMSELAQKEGMLAQIGHLREAGGNLSTSVPVLTAPSMAAFRDHEAKLADELALLQERLGPAHPRVMAARSQLDELHQQIRRETEKILAGLANEAAALGERRSNLVSKIKELQLSAGDQDRADVHLQELQHAAEAQRQMYQSMETRLREIDAEQGIDRPSARIVVKARPNFVPTYPRKSMTIAGAFIGSLLLGIGIALIVRLASRVFHDTDQVQYETGMEVLGLFLEPRRGTEPQDVILDLPLSLASEAVHAVLARLMHGQSCRDGKLGHVVLVSSALPNEGKTSFAIALGRAASGAGFTAIVVDFDLRRPSVLKKLSREQAPGRFAPRSRDTTIDQLLASPMFDERSGLRAIAMGGCGETPHQLLRSSFVASVLHELRSRYQIVLLDSPPVAAVADALQLAPFADDVILVVDWPSSPRQAVITAANAFRRRNARSIGAVLSKVPQRKSGQVFARGGYYAKRYPGYHIESAAE